MITNTKKIWSVIDLFCGTGALSHGLNLGDPRFRVIGGIDTDNNAIQTIKLNNPDGIFLQSNISKITPDEFSKKLNCEAIDVLVAGPPCQGFSSLQPKRGQKFVDPRNHLYKSFLEYVNFFRPRIVLFENVIGILGHKNKYLVDEILCFLKSLNYNCDYRVLNAANYGIPQKRERLFLVATKDKVEVTSLFPKPTHYFEGKVIGIKDKTKYIRNTVYGFKSVSLWDAISDLPSIKSGKKSTNYASQPQNEYQKERRRKTKTLELHVATSHSKRMIEVIKRSGANKDALPNGMVKSGYSSSYSRLCPNSPSTTITVKFTSPASSKCIHPLDDRAITPREAARIQSFDDHFQFFGSKTSIAEQIGNAVPPLFGKAFSSTFSSLLET